MFNEQETMNLLRKPNGYSHYEAIDKIFSLGDQESSKRELETANNIENLAKNIVMSN